MHAAALAELVDVGYGGLTIDGIDATLAVSAIAGAVAYRRLILNDPLTISDAEPLVTTVLGS